MSTSAAVSQFCAAARANLGKHGERVSSRSLLSGEFINQEYLRTYSVVLCGALKSLSVLCGVLKLDQYVQCTTCISVLRSLFFVY